MKIFQRYQEFLAYAIVRPNVQQFLIGEDISSGTKCLKFLEKNVNVKTLHIYIMNAIGCSCLTIFFFDGAQVFQEYAETIYALLAMMVITYGLSVYEDKKVKLFQLINDIENEIEKRKFTT